MSELMGFMGGGLALGGMVNGLAVDHFHIKRD